MPEKVDIAAIPAASITSPQGFFAGAVHTGIKESDPSRLDLAVLFSETPCAVAGTFTRNRIKSAPVVLSQERVARGMARAVVANSGCANACTGEAGLEAAREVTRLVATLLGVPQDSVLMASTGVIGVPLPVDKISDGMARIALTRLGGNDFARAIMTTDTFAKEYALAVKGDGLAYTVAGAAKGAGMIHPNMATMLCFLTTDAMVEPALLRAALKHAVDVSFNMVTVDGDTSPSDTVLLLANGTATRTAIKGSTRAGRAFQVALDRVCVELARSIARDGEGATRLVQVTVAGARSKREARLAARAVAGSALVKAAVYGADPNWGRVVAALGRSGATVDESRLEVRFAGATVMREGRPQDFDSGEAREALRQREVEIGVRLNVGEASATAWGCDLTPEYVTINSAYTT